MSASTLVKTGVASHEHAALAAAIAPDGDVPSVYACYRFAGKLRAHRRLLDECIAGVVGALKKANPLLGWDVAIDASDMPAYANGQRSSSDHSDSVPTHASYGHAGLAGIRSRAITSG